MPILPICHLGGQQFKQNYANSDFLDPEFWISRQLGGQRVKCLLNISFIQGHKKMSPKLRELATVLGASSHKLADICLDNPV